MMVVMEQSEKSEKSENKGLKGDVKQIKVKFGEKKFSFNVQGIEGPGVEQPDAEKVLLANSKKEVKQVKKLTGYDFCAILSENTVNIPPEVSPKTIIPKKIWFNFAHVKAMAEFWIKSEDYELEVVCYLVLIEDMVFEGETD